MNTIKGIPYLEAQFDKSGALIKTAAIPAGTTDLFVISHGWNNNETEADGLYDRFFKGMDNVFGRFAPLTSGDALWTEPNARSEVSIAGTRVLAAFRMYLPTLIGSAVLQADQFTTAVTASRADAGLPEAKTQ